MNNTSTIVATLPSIAITGVTAIEFWIILTVFTGLLGGVISTIGYAAIAAAIKRDKNLRSRFYIILSYVAVSRAFLGVQNLTNFIHRALRTLGVVSTDTNAVTCYMVQFHTYYTLTLEMVLLLGLVIDRTLAVVAFKYYRHLTHKHAHIACTVATVVTVTVKVIVSLSGVQFTSTIACVNADSPTSTLYKLVNANVDLALAVLIVIVYALLIGYTHFWFLPQMNTGALGGQVAATALKQHKKLVPVLSWLLLIHILTAVTVKTVIAMRLYLPYEIGMRLAAYAAVLSPIDLVTNLVVLLTSRKELRVASFPCCGGGNGTEHTNVAVVQIPMRKRQCDIKRL